MNVTQMLLNTSDKFRYDPQPDRRRPGAPGGKENHMHKKAVGRYKELLQGNALATPELAAKLGSSWSSNIIKTLYRLQEMGVVKHVGYAPRKGKYGKCAKLWTWVD